MLEAILAAALSGQAVQQSLPVDLSRAPAPAMEAADPAEYVLGPGDLLWVASEGGLPSEFSAGSAAASVFYTAVSADGFVLLPMVGAVDVNGLTLEEGAALIEQRMRSRIVGVRPSVGLSVARTSMVPVTGGVAAPGAVALRGTDRLVDAIRSAGGPVPGAALSRVAIIGPGGDSTLVDLFAYALSGDPSLDPMLAPGERVHVDIADSLVSVEGAVWVKSPLSPAAAAEAALAEGSSTILEHVPGETAGELVARAGGFAPWALREGCYVLRGGETLPSPDGATPVRPGDRVVVPGTPPTVAVTGYVHTPGVYPFVAGRDAFHYVAQAGGFGPEANGSGTRVHLPDGSEADADELSDIPAGAVVEVPRHTLVWWQDYFTILTGVASIVIAWQSI